MNSLHPIDRPRPDWNDFNLHKYLVFCMIDSNEPYARVCKTFDNLMFEYLNWNSTRGTLAWIPVFLASLTEKQLSKILKKTGYHYHNQMARYLIRWAKGPYSQPSYLKTATREMIVHDITGISWKLASMFLRNSRGLQYAVIDRYIRNYLIEKGYMGPRTGEKGYKLMEKRFIEIANDKGMTPYDLDMQIWNSKRVRHN